MSWFVLGHWSVSRPIVIGTVLLLTGCASVPDVVNPVEWYKDVKDVVTGDRSAGSKSDGKVENRLAADRNKPVSGADKPFPSLSTVPQRPKTSSRAERRRIEQGLVSERTDTRQYSRDVIRRQGESASSLRTSGPSVTPPPTLVAASQAKTADAVPSSSRLAAPKLQPAAPEQAKPVINKSQQIRPAVSVPNRKPNPPKLTMVQNIRTTTGKPGFPQTVLVSG
ncbi:MAG: hypothetical protein P8J29_05435, partial [Rhodospirillales bacterium]|nr:hypothetical protein [Rhodospirillales bacterium]